MANDIQGEVAVTREPFAVRPKGALSLILRFFRAIEELLCQNCCAEELFLDKDLSSREFYPLRTVAGMVMAQNQGSYSRESLFRNHSRDNEIDPFALEIWPLGQRSNVINGSTALLRLPGSLQMNRGNKSHKD